MNICLEGTTSIKQEDTYYSPEELIAMLMQHAKDMSFSQGGKVRAKIRTVSHIRFFLSYILSMYSLVYVCAGTDLF